MPAAPSVSPQPVNEPAPSTTNTLPPIRFRCPKCQKSLKVAGKYAGKVSNCSCGARIRIPNAPANQPTNQPVAPMPELTNTNSDPFDDPFLSLSSNDGTATGKPAYLQPPKAKPKPIVVKKKKKKKKTAAVVHDDGDGSAMGEILGGVGMMVGAVVWFVVGFMGGYIFFYPPILFFVGLASLCKGIFRL